MQIGDDWLCPDGSGPVPGKAMTVTVLCAQELGEATAFDGAELSHATPMEVESRKSFLRVRRADGRVHLLHPETIASAVPCPEPVYLGSRTNLGNRNG